MQQMIPVQEQSDLSSQFKRKQIAIWGFLFLFVITTTGFIFYLAYRMMSEDKPGQAIDVAQSAIKIPISSKPAVAEKKISGDYFLYGEFSPQDKKYKIYKAHYKDLIREEIYSLIWSDPNKLPGLAAHNGYIAIFPTINSNFLINHDGKPATANEFIPPSQYFSISPDGQYMFYFKFMSSLGNPMLVLRDLEKDSDIYSWPMSSPASEVCDFVGWSADGAKAYCVGKKGSVTSLKTFDARKQSYATATTVSNATDARYYAGQSLFLFAAGNEISIYNTNTREKKQIILAPEGARVKNAFLAPDGSSVFYTVASVANEIESNAVYSANIDGSGEKKLQEGKSAILVSLSSNSRDMLFKAEDHYFVSDLDGKGTSELYTADANSPGIQFIGWYLGED